MTIVSTPSATAVCLAVRVSKSASISATVCALLTLLSLMSTKTAEPAVLTALIKAWVATESLLLMALLRRKSRLTLVANAIGRRAGTTRLTQSRRRTSCL